MDSFIIGNIIWNTGLVAVAGFLIKNWMIKVEAGREVNAKAISDNDKALREKLEKSTEATAVEIKDAINNNLEEYRRSCSEIKKSIDKLSEHVATSNGRTGKLEERIAVQVALCELRHKDNK